MAIHRWVLFAVDGRNNGWSYPLCRDSSSSQVEPLGLTANPLARAFAKVMGIGTRFTYARESVVGMRGNAKLTVFANSAVYKGDPAQEIEQAGSCVLVDCWSDDPSKRKKIFLHGVWDAIINAGIVANPAGWATLRDALAAELKNGWGWLGNGAKVRSNLATVLPQPGNRVLFTTVDDVFLPPFDGSQHLPLQVKGVDSVPHMANPVVVIPLSTKTALSLRPYAYPINQSGSVVRNVPVFYPIKTVYMEVATTRRLGRPFRPQAGGRRRNR